MEKYTNDLVNESSPYLLQHAHNPVNWKPWNKNTLELAQREGKLIIISIGYAACHWCHVMEHESFEDVEVADKMNQNYIAIKVDREERPDVDQVYMDAAHLITGRGGWPLNVIALPDGRPIYAGTYFTKQQWLKVLNGVFDFYNTTPEKALEQAMQIAAGVKKMSYVPTPPKTTFKVEVLQKAASNWLNAIDNREGGRAGQMKFPMPGAYLSLLRYASDLKDERGLDLCRLTLDKMAMGGLYDQIGGGFSRYSVDPLWHVPHFEKMLYDNAQLISLYSEAYKYFKDPFYKQIVTETVAFCDRELKNPEGAYFASLDADTEGEEGKFYVWTAQEIDDLLKEDAPLFKSFYGVTENGNWESGKNVLKMSVSLEDLTDKFKLSTEEIGVKLKDSRDRLFEVREQRTRPPLDDKTLTEWNALMITGLTKAYEATSENPYLNKALDVAGFLWQNMWSEGILYRNRKGGKTSINGFLDDYAFTVAAFLDLYQATFDVIWLERSEGLLDVLFADFYDEKTKLFRFKSTQDDPLFVAKSVIEDNVIPAGNSQMGLNLFRIGKLLDKSKYLEASSNMLKQAAGNVEEHASFYYNWFDLYRLQIREFSEIVILGENYENKRSELVTNLLPNSVVLGGAKEAYLPLLKQKKVQGKTLIYVCIDKSCQMPVELVSDAFEQI